MGAILKNGISYSGGGSGSSVIEITQAEYDKLSTEEKQKDVTYFITDAQGGGSGSTSAEAVSYNGSTSGLTATNVQGAIDEVAGDVSELNLCLMKPNYSRAVNMSIDGFTAQENGFASLYARYDGEMPLSLSVNENLICSGFYKSTASVFAFLPIVPIAKGDNVTCYVPDGTYEAGIKFIPCK